MEAVQREKSLSKAKLAAQAAKIREIEAELLRIGVRPTFSVHAPYTPIGKFDLASSSDKIRQNTIESVAACVDLAEAMGAQVVNTHLGGIIDAAEQSSFSNPGAKKSALSRLRDAMVDLTARIEGRSVFLAIENVPYPLEEIAHGYSPLIGIFACDFLKIIGDVRSRDLGVTADFCHLWITHKTLKGLTTTAQSKESSSEAGALRYYRGLTSYESEAIESLAKSPFESFVKPLCEKIIHIHAADSKGTYLPGKSSVSEGLPLGEGDMDLRAFAESLRQIQSCSEKAGAMMIVLEPKEEDLNRPINSLRSLLTLSELMKGRVDSHTERDSCSYVSDK